MSTVRRPSRSPERSSGVTPTWLNSAVFLRVRSLARGAAPIVQRSTLVFTDSVATLDERGRMVAGGVPVSR